MNSAEILRKLPYTKPFLFVDELEHVSEDGVSGFYTFPEGSFFYQGHFKNKAVTPGVILTECMAQIGVVCLGIFLLNNEDPDNFAVALSNTNADFFLPVFPGEIVRVVSEKIFFRFQKLKCKTKMYNAEGKLVCTAEISGMIKHNE